MSIAGFAKGELLEIIEWTDPTRDTLCFRFPDDDKAIKRGAQLIVRESQVAVPASTDWSPTTSLS
jgi:membrane protease subunit (stomatin/prohibitin family)